jgi:rfaE bifunctional protein nucleotidyltransferase chain/domain
MHSGHVAYLGEARKLGDVLVVGLNSDRSVRVIKGPDRPIVPQAQRAQVLAALSAVDYVVIFEDPAPTDLLEALRPDVYVKGGDYTVDTINQDERAIVQGYGGKIAFVPLVPGTSTTTIVERIRNTGQRHLDSR